MTNDTQGLFNTVISGISAIAAFATSVQPIISALAGLAAICSAFFAIRYYIIKSSTRKNNEKTDS
jgi:ammonia channel protein AmtB